MAFNLFKKKSDDFSDFGDSPSEPRMESSAMDQPHMGLPPDGDITNISRGPGSNQNMGLPTESEVSSTSAPTSFNEFSSMKSQQAFTSSQQQPVDDSIHEVSHKPTRTELMTKVNNLEKDMEVVTAKLDTIKSLLDSMNHKMEHLEDAATGKKTEEVRW